MRYRQVLSATLLASSLCLSARAADLAAGVASVDITPPVGYRMAGYFNERINTGTHDPLQAKALVLAQGDTQAAIVFCDLVGIPLEVSRKAREQAWLATHIPVTNIAIVATHTHTAPLYFGSLYDYFHGAAAKDGPDPHEPVAYSQLLTDKIVEVVGKAQTALRPVRVAAGSAVQSPTLSFHRRYQMKDGSVQWNPGQQNPDIVAPAGPIDPEVGLLAFQRRGQEQPCALLTVFAMHADTTGETEYSADYPYYLGQGLGSTLGPELVSLFGVGTCGNINHIDVKVKGRRSAEQIGSLLAETVAANLPRLRVMGSPLLAVSSKKVAVPMKPFAPERREQAAREMAMIGTKELPFLRQVETARIMSTPLRPSWSLPLEVQVFRIGPEAAVVTLPGEFFVELGLAIKKASPFPTTLVIELANESPGYVPTREGFKAGAYEAVNTSLSSGSGELLADTALALLKELAGSAPAAATASRPSAGGG